MEVFLISPFFGGRKIYLGIKVTEREREGWGEREIFCIHWFTLQVSAKAKTWNLELHPCLQHGSQTARHFCCLPRCISRCQIRRSTSETRTDARMRCQCLRLRLDLLHHNTVPPPFAFITQSISQCDYAGMLFHLCAFKWCAVQLCHMDPSRFVLSIPCYWLFGLLPTFLLLNN